MTKISEECSAENVEEVAMPYGKPKQLSGTTFSG
jgi:hypothetical protein